MKNTFLIALVCLLGWKHSTTAQVAAQSGPTVVVKTGKLAGAATTDGGAVFNPAKFG